MIDLRQAKLGKDGFMIEDKPRPIYRLVEKREQPDKIIRLLGLDPAKVHAWTFESCSFVVAMRDGKTLHEACFCPRGVTTWEEPEIPLFQQEAE